MTRKDPTATTVLRSQFTTQFSKRYRVIKGNINRSIDSNDCFYLKDTGISAALEDDSFGATVPVEPLPERSLGGLPVEKQTEAFLSWFDRLKMAYVFQASIYGSYWFSAYIIYSYKKGIAWARKNIKRDRHVLKEYGNEPDSLKTDDLAIRMAVNSPDHAEILDGLKLKVYLDLVNIDSAEKTSISRILTSGILASDSPKEVAERITNAVDSVGLYRSRLLARTEIIRAHHRAAIQEYRRAGIKGVKVYAEWTTARDSRVCPRCSGLDFRRTKKYWTLDEIEGKIPLHPQCRCAALPAVKDNFK